MVTDIEYEAMLKDCENRSSIYQEAHNKSLRYFLGRLGLMSQIDSQSNHDFALGTIEYDAWYAGWNDGRERAQNTKVTKKTDTL